MGGWGDVNVHCIASSENVVTLKMLLRSRSWYVEDVVTFKMLLRWRCCAPTNAFKTALWMWREERLMCISPMVLWWIMTCLCLSKETWNSKKARKSYRKSKNDGEYQLLNLKKNIEHWNSRQHIPDMLSGCWTNSWYCHVIGRTQNTVKHNEQWHVSNWNTMNFNCLPRNRQPLPYIYIYTHTV